MSYQIVECSTIGTVSTTSVASNMDRFSIKSLLNHYTAAQTPLTLLYWTTRAFSLGVKEAYKPRFFFWPAAASFTTLFTSARMFGTIAEGPCSRTRHQLVNSVLICSSGSLWSATPTKALSACAHVHA